MLRTLGGFFGFGDFGKDGTNLQGPSCPVCPQYGLKWETYTFYWSTNRWPTLSADGLSIKYISRKLDAGNNTNTAISNAQKWLSDRNLQEQNLKVQVQNNIDAKKQQEQQVARQKQAEEARKRREQQERAAREQAAKEAQQRAAAASAAAEKAAAAKAAAAKVAAEAKQAAASIDQKLTTLLSVAGDKVNQPDVQTYIKSLLASDASVQAWKAAGYNLSSDLKSVTAQLKTYYKSGKTDWPQAITYGNKVAEILEKVIAFKIPEPPKPKPKPKPKLKPKERRRGDARDKRYDRRRRPSRRPSRDKGHRKRPFREKEIPTKAVAKEAAKAVAEAAPAAPTCKEGQILENNVCVWPPCPTGQTREGDKCVWPPCPSGQKREGDKCVPDIPTDWQQFHDKLKCPKGKSPQFPNVWYDQEAAKRYLAKYPDVAAAVKGNLKQALRHYACMGSKENRTWAGLRPGHLSGIFANWDRNT